MVDEYLTVATDADAAIEVKRSRFLARVRRVPDEAHARGVIEDCRKQYWDARHHCSAFVLGAAGQVTRSNDDGEPSGTAGAPILAAINGRDLRDVVVVVSRYFGGTLLGAGGLVRAYTDSAVAGLEQAGTLRRRRALQVHVSVPIADLGRVENAVRATGMSVDDVRYTANAVLSGAVALGAFDALAGQVASLTQGTGVVKQAGTRWVDSR